MLENNAQANTRAQNILKGFDDKARAAADKYIVARDALLGLAGGDISRSSG